MSLAIRPIESELIFWDDEFKLKEIRMLFAPTLSDLEFKAYVAMGKATNLNPFLREIWAIKYAKDKPAQIFIGRDGYRKGAQRHPLYEYHVADAVYSGDKFETSNGEVMHVYNFGNRGELIGAYSSVQRKGSRRPSFVFVEHDEYVLKQGVWIGKPATMIRKVAEAQALRMAFQDLFAGSYHEYERWDDHAPKQVNVQSKGMDGLKQKLGLVPTPQPEVVNDTGEILDIEPEIESTGDDMLDYVTHGAPSVKDKVEAAATLDQLKDIIKEINAIDSTSEKKELMKLYRERHKELS